MAAGDICLNIVTALESEARPLIRRLDLHAVPETTVRPLYVGERIALTVSGIGRQAAEAGVKFLMLSEAAHYALGRRPAHGGVEAAWLNVGVGGHRDRPIGQGILAHRVEDASWSRAWYPRFVFDPPCPTETVRTVDHVERQYLDPVVYEMEAAGFAGAASAAASSELVHVYKVISDGLEAPVDRVNEAFIEQLIESNVDEIAGIAEKLISLAEEAAGSKALPPGFEGLRAQWRFTQTQQHQLHRLLVRWQATMGEAPPEEVVRGARHPREVLDVLERELRDAPPPMDADGGTT